MKVNYAAQLYSESVASALEVVERLSLPQFHCLTRFNKIAIQGAPQMAVDKEAISLSRVYSYYSKCNLPLFYV